MMIAHRPSHRPSRPAGLRAGARGFTMAEVLVAIGVLSVAFLGIITVILVGQADISQSGHDTLAAAAAQSLAENLRNQPQDDLPQYNGMATADKTQCPGNAGPPPDKVNKLCTDWIDQFTQTFPQGSGTVSVVLTANPTTNITLYQITITVSWAEVVAGSTRRLTVVMGRSA